MIEINYLSKLVSIILSIVFCLVLLFLTPVADEPKVAFDDITFEDLRNADYDLNKVSTEKIKSHENLLFVKTNEGRYAKLLLGYLSSSIVLWYKITIYNSDGTILENLSDIIFKVNEPYDLDNLKSKDKSADIVLKKEINIFLEITYYISGLNHTQLALPNVKEIFESKYSGELLIDSTPSNAKIYVDDKWRGKTPKEISLIEGSHEIKIVKSGYEIWRKQISIKKGVREKINAQLAKLPQPILRWAYEADKGISSPVLGDLNGDGKLDVIFGSYDNHVYTLDSEGSLLWSFDAGYSVGSPALGDINADEKLEVVVGVGLSYDLESYVYALDYNGNMLWKYEVDLGAAYSTPTLGDLNGDETLEIIIGTEYGILYALSPDGRLIWKYKVSGPIRTSPSLGDLNADGQMEVVFGSDDGYIYALDPNGKLLWEYEAGFNIRSSPLLADFEGDEETKIVFGSLDDKIYQLNSQGELEWVFNSKKLICASPAVADINQDGNLEVLIGSCYGSDPHIYVISSVGKLLWSHSIPGSILSSPVIGDVDGDGNLEVIIGSYQGSVLILNSDGELEGLYKTKNRVYSSLALGDLENDGRMEILASDKLEGPLRGVFYVLNSEGTGEIQWACFGGNPWHTGNADDALSYGKALMKGPKAATLWALSKETGEEENLAPTASFTFSPKEPTDLDIVHFTDQSSDPDGKIIKWEWDFGDGKKSNEQNPSHKYQDDGLYKVTLTVTDEEGATDSISKTITVSNVPPKAEFTFSPQKPKVGEKIIFNACSSSDKDGTIKQYQWDWDSEVTAWTFVPSCKIEHIFRKAGRYKVALKVLDDDSDTDAVTRAINVAKENIPPKAVFYFTPEKPTDLDEIQFKNESTDSDGEIVSWQWNFGDGAVSKERNPTHKYSDEGVYTVRLKVTDDKGTAETITKTISVSNLPPEAEFTYSPENPKTEEKITFNACSSKDRDGTVENYEWDWEGDGKLDDLTSSCEIEHSFTVAREYKVTLRVTDNDGDPNSITKAVKIAENNPPKARFTHQPKEPKDVDKIKFKDESTDPDGEITKWHWDFGDGSTITTQNPTHKYKDDGTYTVKLTVTDNNGATDTVTEKIKVSNVPPKADFSVSPSKLIIQAPVTFDASISDDPDGTIDSYQWDFDEDGKVDKEGVKVKYTYTDARTYKVKLTVTDNDEATDSKEKEITVSEVPPEIKERYAIVIGISDYKNGTPDFPLCRESLCDLKYPATDAKAFYDLLVDENVGNFSEKNVILLTNEEATNKAITSAFGKLMSQVEEGDLVVIYYSGHGSQGYDHDGDEEDGRDEYYVPYDYEIGDLFGTAIRDDEFGNWMDSLRSRKVAIFLDNCFSGGATKAIKGTTPAGYKAPADNSVFNDFSLEDRILISASQENQFSWESDQLGHGVFTYYLLKALGGGADLNGDEKIEVSEVYEFVKPRVKEYVLKHWPNYMQVPLVRGKGKGGIPLVAGVRQVGSVTAIEEKKQEAKLGDKVLISLGRKQGIEVGDILEVYHLYRPKTVSIEEIRGRLKVIELVGGERALCEVIESIVAIEVGDRVRQIREGSEG